MDKHIRELQALAGIVPRTKTQTNLNESEQRELNQLRELAGITAPRKKIDESIVGGMQGIRHVSDRGEQQVAEDHPLAHHRYNQDEEDADRQLAADPEIDRNYNDEFSDDDIFSQGDRVEYNDEEHIDGTGNPEDYMDDMRWLHDYEDTAEPEQPSQLDRMEDDFARYRASVHESEHTNAINSLEKAILAGRENVQRGLDPEGTVVALAKEFHLNSDEQRKLYDEIMKVQEDMFADRAQSVSEDFDNGYDSQIDVDADGYFPDGAHGSVSDSAGPASAKQGDNPMQKAMKEGADDLDDAMHTARHYARNESQLREAKEIKKSLVYGYRKFMKENRS